MHNNNGPEDWLSLSDYIVIYAGRGGSSEHILHIFRTFGHDSVLLSIDESAPRPEDERPFALVYASKSDRRLPGRFAEMPLLQAARLVCSVREFNGLLIQSEAAARLSVQKDVLRELLDRMNN